MPDRRSRRRGLPRFILGALYALLVSLPVAVALATGEGHRLALMRASAATGMAAAAMILLQMVSSGRFEAISGRIGIDITMGFHKWAAPVALLLALAHVVFFVGPPDMERPHRFAGRLSAILRADDLFDARLALILFALLVALALLRDRLPLRYEAWRATHALGALALLAVLLRHVLSDGRGGGLATLLWGTFAVAVALPAVGVYARRLTAPASGDWTIATNRRVADRLWEVTLDPPTGCSLDFRAGQFAWVVFGGRRLPLYDHPFSIASDPGAPRLGFLIQEAGDFTDRIGTLPPGTRVGLDAPHGSFGLDPDGKGAILLIAGGVGIAPVLSVLAELARTGCRRPVRLIYAARGPGAMLPESFFRPACETLGVAPLLLVDRGAGAAGLEPGPLTQAHLERALSGLDPGRAEALICGPAPMMTMATDGLARLGVLLSAISYERFSYGGGEMSGKDRRIIAGFVAVWAVVAAVLAAYSLP